MSLLLWILCLISKQNYQNTDQNYKILAMRGHGMEMEGWIYRQFRERKVLYKVFMTVTVLGALQMLFHLILKILLVAIIIF